MNLMMWYYELAKVEAVLDCTRPQCVDTQIIVVIGLIISATTGIASMYCLNSQQQKKIQMLLLLLTLRLEIIF